MNYPIMAAVLAATHEVSIVKHGVNEMLVTSAGLAIRLQVRARNCYGPGFL